MLGLCHMRACFFVALWYVPPSDWKGQMGRSIDCLMLRPNVEWLDISCLFGQAIERLELSAIIRSIDTWDCCLMLSGCPHAPSGMRWEQKKPLNYQYIMCERFAIEWSWGLARVRWRVALGGGATRAGGGGGAADVFLLSLVLGLRIALTAVCVVLLQVPGLVAACAICRYGIINMIVFTFICRYGINNSYDTKYEW